MDRYYVNFEYNDGEVIKRVYLGNFDTVQDKVMREVRMNLTKLSKVTYYDSNKVYIKSITIS